VDRLQRAVRGGAVHDDMLDLDALLGGDRGESVTDSSRAVEADGDDRKTHRDLYRLVRRSSIGPGTSVRSFTNALSATLRSDDQTGKPSRLGWIGYADSAPRNIAR